MKHTIEKPWTLTIMDDEIYGSSIKDGVYKVVDLSVALELQNESLSVYKDWKKAIDDLKESETRESAFKAERDRLKIRH